MGAGFPAHISLRKLVNLYAYPALGHVPEKLIDFSIILDIGYIRCLSHDFGLIQSKVMDVIWDNATPVRLPVSHEQPNFRHKRKNRRKIKTCTSCACLLSRRGGHDVDRLAIVSKAVCALRSPRSWPQPEWRRVCCPRPSAIRRHIPRRHLSVPSAHSCAACHSIPRSYEWPAQHWYK